MGTLDELDFPTEEEGEVADDKVPDPPKIRPGHYNLAKDVAGLSLSDASKAYYAAWAECGYDPKKLDAEFKAVLDKVATARGVKKQEEKVRKPPRTPPRSQQPPSQGQGWQQGPGQMIPYEPKLVDASLAKLIEEMAMPNAFMCLIKRKGTDQLEPYIKAAGLALKSEQKGIQWLETAVTRDPDNPEGYIGNCELMPELTQLQVDAIKALNGLPESVAKELADKIMRPITGIGTANPQNCRRVTNLKEMAETRARVRAQRIHVGYGFTALEELPPEAVETVEDRIAKAKNVTPDAKDKEGS